ncbi:hypothetical protein H2O64_02710 [Kordia sp. YSTF-M3]|uniref:Toxin-antitoxin system YwqK family antitoxin n=1 Tax=Kordia aestuariivivens TaxID=2759037 RepID=A0ABR7Q4T1_9FLAO|nr:hypothetical protein [Kordia aestuariivivens]MBC8753566.1 hypothetical protein [Kordia aestuariivivens]
MKKKYQWILVSIAGVLILTNFIIKTRRNSQNNLPTTIPNFNFESIKTDSVVSLNKTRINKTIKDSGAYNHNGNKNGKWTTYFQHNGKVYLTGKYDDGKKEGIWKSYSTDNYLICTTVYKKGNLTKEIFYHDNGQIFTICDVLNGKKIGVEKRYHIDGTLDYIVKYKDTLENGNFSAYHPNGTIKSEGKVVEGYEDGDYKYYNETGELISIINFKHGEQTIVYEKE